MTKIYIDPRCKVNYATYYIHGLWQKFGKRNVAFDVTRFSQTSLDNFNVQWHGMSFIIENGSTCKKIYIDYHDSGTIQESAYQWADVYAKVNLKTEDKTLSKVIAIGPGFGIDIWNWVELVQLSIINFFSAAKLLKLPKKQYFLDYLYTKIRRKPYSFYTDLNKLNYEKKYIFSVSTLWPESYITNTNLFRKKFFLTANKFFKFEGGFYKIPTSDPTYEKYASQYEDLIITRRISMEEYLIKTKKSVAVFNTPAVGDCHGWKLGEYLALHKFIISTPFLREMPGDNLDFLKQIPDIEALERLLNEIAVDDLKVKEYETATKVYFEKYLSPLAVISRITSDF